MEININSTAGATSGQMQYVKDGSVVSVTLDTGTPANSNPAPIILLDSLGAIQGSAANPLRVDPSGTTAQKVNLQDGAGSAVNKGQAAMAGSLPVVLASDQSAIPVTQSGTWSVRLQDGAGSTVIKGQGLMAASLPVVLASDQSAIPVTQSGTWNMRLQDGSGTAVNVGQGAMAASLPVVLASNQTAIPVTQSGAWSLSANQSVNLAQVVGTATAVNNGTASAGCQRVVIASDNTAFSVNATLQTGSNVIGALTANQSVNVAQVNGVTVLMGAGNTGTGSQRVTIATDQAAVATKAPVNAAGNSVESTVSTVVTASVPANAVGFVLMNHDTSSANIRFRIGATATAASGIQLQPGRDTGYIPCAANISICAESGTQNYHLQWILSA